jgi:hypothetical protein
LEKHTRIVCLNNTIENWKNKYYLSTEKCNNKEKEMLLGNPCDENPLIFYQLTEQIPVESRISCAIKVEWKNTEIVILGFEESNIYFLNENLLFKNDFEYFSVQKLLYVKLFNNNAQL